MHIGLEPTPERQGKAMAHTNSQWLDEGSLGVLFIRSPVPTVIYDPRYGANRYICPEPESVIYRELRVCWHSAANRGRGGGAHVGCDLLGGQVVGVPRAKRCEFDPARLHRFVHLCPDVE
jgi:hypothetical protein